MKWVWYWSGLKLTKMESYNFEFMARGYNVHVIFHIVSGYIKQCYFSEHNNYGYQWLKLLIKSLTL